MYVICEMLRRGYGRERIRTALLDAGNGISGKAYEEQNPAQYVDRQIDHGVTKIELLCDEKGIPYRSPDNIRVALLKLGITLRHDVFAGRSLIAGLPEFGPALDDAAAVRIFMLLDQQFELRPTKDLLIDVLADTARLNAFHPVRDYLNGLRWDGKLRIDTWLHTYGGAPDNEYTRAVGALMLIAAARRVRQPGCKFDEMLVFEGTQGSERSTVLATLAVKSEWFSDDLPLNAESKVVIERLRGRWIVEAAELSGMRRGDIEHIKAFLSRQVDRARPAYGRFLIEAPRQCIVVGTTNDAAYLRDHTGNRRFWPVATPRWKLKELQHDRDRLWAEAATREAQDASIRLPPELWPRAASEQSKRAIIDPYVDELKEYLGGMYGKIRATDVWKIIGLPAGQRTQTHNERMGNAMRAIGWQRTQLRFGHGPEGAYYRDNPKGGLLTNVREQICVRRLDHNNVKVFYGNDGVDNADK